MMQLSDFDYALDSSLIATVPLPERSSSRLLTLQRDNGNISHENFTSIIEKIEKGDVLVLNDTKVIPARIQAKKVSGGKVELLVERIVSPYLVLACLKSSKPVRSGQVLCVENFQLRVREHREQKFLVEIDPPTTIYSLLEHYGEMPIPLYFKRKEMPLDKVRYQTVYAKNEGAIAAPTAGLHFTKNILDQLETKGVELVYLTLHVGYGTFQPIRVDDITQHRMHKEYIEVSKTACDVINKAKKEKRRIIGVGTTSVRALESVAKSGKVQPYQGETDLFIYPGYTFQIVDEIITNFHLPKSSLFILVCAFAGQQNILRAYDEAIKHGYRFYSYGDAMYISNRNHG